MLKLAAAAAIALVIGASPSAYAQARAGGSAQRLEPAELGMLTDVHVHLVKAALQLTPDQEKYWAPIESAIRARAKNRQDRLAKIVQTEDHSSIETMRDRDPVDFLHKRADALAQRSADLKKLADAWEPLYKTLSDEQKHRLAFLAIFVIREMRDRLEQQRVEDYDGEG